MAKNNSSSLLDGEEDIAGNTPKAPPQSDDVWNRAGEDAKREKRGEPPLTDSEWNEMRADENGEIVEGRAAVEITGQGQVDVEEIELVPEAPETPRSSRKRQPKEDLLGEAPAKAPAKPKGGKGTDSAVKAAADRAEAAHERKKGGGKLPGAVDQGALAAKTEETKKRRGRKPKAEQDAETPAEKVDAVRKASSGNTVGIAGGRILAFVQRVENLEEEVKSVQTDIKEIFMEAKGEGFDVKVIKRIIKTRKIDKDKMDEEDSLFDLYMMAIENAVEEEAA